VRRLAVLLAGGALWLLLSASAAFADGGPHQLTVNSGTAGLSGDCAACHRAHTAQAADLLKASMPGLCLTCHDGTGATTNVVDGYQFVPDGAGDPTSAVLGALRGGGFDYALIGAPARLTYNSRGGIVVSYDAAPTTGSVTLAWPAFTGFLGGDLTYDPTVGPTQAQLDALFLTSTTYTSSTATANMSSPTTSNMKASVDATKKTVTFNPQNGFRIVTVSTPTVSDDTTGQHATVSNLLQANMGETSKVAVLAVANRLATTSTHEGAGTVWGNGPQGQNNAGATGVALECTGCHNPHGNGQYRILNTHPGEDWTDGVNGVASWTAPVNGVEVADVGSTATTKNYTVLPGVQAGDVTASATAGDYFRYKFDPSGAANFTNFYLKADPMNTGWAGTPTNKDNNGNVAPANTSGLMTAWCITCHTRYNGYSTNGTTSLVLQTPADSEFMYKHGTSRIGCEQCHVSHGTDAAMTAQFSSSAQFPDGSSEDSALLKVANRGTCNLCHEPTHTVKAGTTVGTVPLLITPGP
jgi:predicted CXXCH cytochrome family protein